MKIRNKYEEIRKDIVDNIDEVFNRCNYYTKKYRGDRFNDINVSLEDEDLADKKVQIYLKNEEGYIKELLHVTNNKITHTVIKTNLNDGK